MAVLGLRSFVGRLGLVAVLLAGVCFEGRAAAQTVSFPATADTYLRQGSANQNNGQDTLLHVQQSGHNRVLVAMDSAAIAAAVGSGSLASATLELYVSNSSGWGTAGRTVDLHRMTTTWTENGATWNCALDSIPTNSQPNCATQWDGGKFDDEASDSVLHVNTTSGFVEWNVTDDVRAFIGGTPNYGWLAKLSDETLGGNVDYASRQAGTAAQRPRLVLVVESPAFDQVPPSISITTPAHPFVINDTTPAISVSYADGGSGIATATLDVKVDGTAAVCTASASSATCEPTSLAEGTHAITATVRDAAGNSASATRGFTLLIGPGLRSATFSATADTMLKKSSANQNFGGDLTLRLRQSGKNRSLARFDAAEIAQTIGQGTLRSASLELQVGNSSGWGKTGRMVDAHRLTADWTEAEATWNCGIDTIPTNSQANCTTQWAGGTFQATPTSTVVHTNGQTGTVAFEVTPDVAALVAGTSPYGWLIKKSDETRSGKADYAAREAGAPNAARLVVLFEVPGSGDTTPPFLHLEAPSTDLLFNQPRPTIRLSFLDTDSGIDPSSLKITVDGVAVTAGCTTTESGAVCLPAADLSAGDHALRAEVKDRAGNLTQAGLDLQIVLDSLAPNLALIENPERFEGEPGTLLIQLTDAGSGIDPATFSATLAGQPLSDCSVGEDLAICQVAPRAAGQLPLVAEVRDLAGNVGRLETTIEILAERGLPTLAIVVPLPGPLFGAHLPAIELAYSDAVSGIDPASLDVSVDGASIAAECTVRSDGANCPSRALAPGPHTVAAEISDHSGNRRRAEVEVDLSVALDVAITSPAGGTIVREPTVRLEGTVSPLATSVEVAGVPAQLGAGTWVAPAVPIREGGNTLTAVARSSEGGVGTATVAVIRDSEAPRVAILTPHDGFVTSASQIVVSGDLVDSVSTSSKQRALRVRVNEHEAVVERKSFVLTDLLLVPGENRIEVTAEDEAGNVGRSAITVRFVPDAVARIEEISGNFQEAEISDTLGQPLVVRIVDFLGRPLAGRTVDFAVTRGDGSLLSFPDAARHLSGVTNEEGLAAMRFALGTRAGAGNQEVTVSSVGIPGSVLFCASARPKPAKQVQPIAATDFQGAKTGPAGQALPKPLFVQVFDGFGNPVAGQEVIFRSVEGGGTFAGALETRVTTDDEGKAGAVFTLDPDEGINNNRVEVNFDGATDPPARFIISGLIPGPAELTAMAGVVLDPSDAPVPGARIHIGSNETRTDAEGRFRLNGVPVGTVHVEIDGSTVTRPGTWPPLGYELVMISGRVNELGKPMRLPQIDDAGKKHVGGDQDVTIPIHGVAGAMMTVFAHSVTFPDGSHEGYVAFTQVPAQKVPMVAPQNAGFMLAWTIQPAGVHFDPPARVSIPNFGVPGGGGNPPGLTGEIFSFDHDLGEFVSAGTASITEDGMMMMSNPGMGISKAGWGGCPHPPAPPAQACDGGKCTVCPIGGGPPVSRCATCSVCSGEGCLPETLEGEEADVEEDPPMDEPAAGLVRAAGGPKRVSLNRPATFFAKKRAPVPNFCTHPHYVWDFGDHQTAMGRFVTHAYQKPGPFTATLTLTCQGCDVARVERTVAVQVEGTIDFEPDLAIASNQLPSLECNTLPPRVGPPRSASNIPMILGAQSGDEASLVVHQKVSHREAAAIAYVGIRPMGGGEIVKSVKAAGSKLPTEIRFNSGPVFEKVYEVVVGFDQDGSGDLDEDEVEKAYPQGFRVIGGGEYLESFNDFQNQRRLFPIDGIGYELTGFFLNASVPAGSGPPGTTQVDFYNNAFGISHPTGADWQANCTASVPNVVYAPSSSFSSRFGMTSTVSRKAATDFLIRHRTEIATFLITHPVAVESYIQLSGADLGDGSYQAEVNSSDWDKFVTAERDFFLAFGKVSVTGRVNSVTLYRNFRGDLVLNEMDFGGGITDTVDYNVKATLHGVPITKPAAELQAGAPTLGASGAIFRDALTFANVKVIPAQFGLIYLPGL
ncbi:MAG: DNRLRE domain-containing protein [Acidobacteriota bacterium]